MLWRPRQQCNLDYLRLLQTFFPRTFSSQVLRREEALVILGVPYDASKQEIKDAFLKLSKILHPDVNRSVNATEEFQRAKSAYDLLMNSSQTEQKYSPNGTEEDYYHQPSPEEWRRWRSRQRRTKEFDDWLKNVARERRQGPGQGEARDDKVDFNEGWMGWGWEKQKEADKKREDLFDKIKKHNGNDFHHAEAPFIKFVDMMFCMPMNQLPHHSAFILKILIKISIFLSFIAIVGISYEIHLEMNFDNPPKKEARPEYVDAVKQKSGTLDDL